MKITIKQARIGKGLTLTEMAESLGISHPTYVSIEKNPARCTIAQAAKIAEVTGYSVEDIDFFCTDTLIK